MIDLSKFKTIFISEVEDQIQKLNSNLLLLEKSINSKKGSQDKSNILNEMMRASHTIKGSSASMGFNKMAFLSHVMEDIFDASRNNVLDLDTSIINRLFKSIDNIEKSLNCIKEDKNEIDYTEFSNELKTITGVNTTGVGKSDRSEKADPATVQITEASEKKEAPAKVEKEKEKAEEDENYEVSKIDYIKVPVSRLDTLMDQVEELIIDRMRLKQLSMKTPQLKELANHIDLLISGIQYEVMQARLIPVEQVFARFPRMIRDLSTKQGKKINLEIKGGEIELDRTVVDKLGEPLIHLLRNAVDHGIEKEGTIKLEAIRQSESVLFIVENDGCGIDMEKVKQVAVKRGFVNPADIQKYEESQLVNLLFHANFSTSDKVTEISGRGVGLSIVKKFTDSHGGRVIVKNLPHGARFTLELPSTLAIINALLVSVGKLYFAIPFNNVERSINVGNEHIKRMADRDMALVDGINIPLIKLREVFNIKQLEGSSLEEELTTVLVKKGDELAGIVVDELVDEQEIIVKPFSSILQNIKGFSGSTILGDGRVVLILDIFNLLKYASTK